MTIEVTQIGFGRIKAPLMLSFLWMGRVKLKVAN